MSENPLRLFCLVDGETTSNAFSVKASPSDTVDDLKKLIKAEKTPEFDDIASNKLTLWRVSILTIMQNTPIKLNDLDDKTGLTNPRTCLFTLFAESPDDDTYILVQRPPQDIDNVSTLRSGHPWNRSRSSTKRSGEHEPDTPRKLPKIFGATSISETRMFQTTDDKEQSQQVLELPQDLPNFFSWRTTAGTVFADKTPYIEELERGATNYRYVFLRPRRFGKSAFLNMLCAYYDVHNASIFDDLFGPLYIGRNPTTSKSKHLVLILDLSTISVSGSLEAIMTSFNKKINGVLKKFLQKYNSELYPEEMEIIDKEDASQSLSNILSLVQTRGQSLFIGVDEYDAPANNSAFAGGNTVLGGGVLDNVRLIEQFFKEKLFSVLKEGCSTPSMNEYGVVISKYFLTGVTPAFRAGISPLTAAAIISNEPDMHGICGFSESEVNAIVKHYLGMSDQEAEPLLHSIRRLYNGYCFTSIGYKQSSSQPPPVYNPHLVFHYLRNFKRSGFVAKPEESTAVHSTTILKSIADVGEFSVNDLIELIVTESVQSRLVTEFGYSELLSVGKNREITWSLLFYLGILTLCPNGSLRVPNDVIKSEVLGRIATFLRTQDKISTLMTPAIRSLRAGNADEFRELLEKFLSRRALRSLANANESVLQGIVELLLDEPGNRVPELRLVLDGSKELGDGRFGYVDIFIPRLAMASGSEQTCVVMELKNATLEGLWRGTTSRKSDYKDLERLYGLLSTEDEPTLLSRKYAYWSQVDRGWKTVTLKSIMEDGVRQLKRYMKTIELGEVRSYNTSGVFDNRVNIDCGLDDLEGYVIMAIGGVRVIVRHLEPIATPFEYVRAIQL